VLPYELRRRALRQMTASAGQRVAVVAEGCGTIGRAVVRALAQRRMRVIMATSSPAEGRAELDALGDLTDQIAVRHLDLTDRESIARLFSWLEQRLGRCDVLVSNVATVADEGLVLLIHWRLAQAAAPLMRWHRYGRIVNVYSRRADLGPVPGPDIPAIRVATRILAAELAADGILVNACCPDPPDAIAPAIDTAMRLVTLPAGGPTGGLFRGRGPITQ
jgi:NAD(P)-dependent dehydrogenase (short-subunit alcohol dehydrogenase family)